MEKLHCPCCMGLSLETRFDVKSRPYLTCGSCSVRIFPRGIASIVGLAQISPLIGELRSRISTDRSEWERSQETCRQVEASMRQSTKPALPETATAASLAVAGGER